MRYKNQFFTPSHISHTAFPQRPDSKEHIHSTKSFFLIELKKLLILLCFVQIGQLFLCSPLLINYIFLLLQNIKIKGLKVLPDPHTVQSMYFCLFSFTLADSFVLKKTLCSILGCDWYHSIQSWPDNVWMAAYSQNFSFSLSLSVTSLSFSFE